MQKHIQTKGKGYSEWHRKNVKTDTVLQLEFLRKELQNVRVTFNATWHCDPIVTLLSGQWTKRNLYPPWK